MNKVSLANKTSLQKLNFKFRKTNILMKRDDTIDFALGGNKVRLFEYISRIILERKVKKIVTYGSIYSNFVRVAAAVSSKLHLGCDIIIIKGENEPIGENIRLLQQYYDVNFKFCSNENATHFIDNYKYYLNNKGENYMWIPGGGCLSEASLGYLDASVEIIQQLKENNEIVDAVFLPCGTGTTQSGLVLGFRNMNIPIIGVSVARSVDRCISEINKHLLALSKLNNSLVGNYNFKVIKNENVRYGQRNTLINKTMRQVAESDGIFLDPIYNAPAFFEMTRYLEQNYHLKNVLYINTGGQPNIFMKE